MIFQQLIAQPRKHLGMNLDEKLNFGHHITEKIAKAKKVIGVTCFPTYDTSNYKSFIRPNLDYGDFIYNHLMIHFTVR